MGRIFVVELEGRTYNCKFCKTHLALADDLVSRAFHSRSGKAYLFNKACHIVFAYHTVLHHHIMKKKDEDHEMVNISFGPHEERMMLSGMHTVADIYCCCCGQMVGWKYEAAHDQSQKYKEGKFVLERGRILDGLDLEFYTDTHPTMSDAEDA